jgi:hypothetical protein
MCRDRSNNIELPPTDLAMLNPPANWSICPSETIPVVVATSKPSAITKPLTQITLIA